ncbi:MAG: cysteine desulfurase family protein [Sphaerochaetaceae bacterium]
MKRSYFDWAATTYLAREALERYNEVATLYWANPSAVHADGKQAALFLQEQRELSAQLLDVDSKQIFYTSGGTESNSIIFNSLLWKRTQGEIIISSLEHASVSQYTRLLEHHGFTVHVVKAKDGYIDLQHFESLLNENTQLVSLMLVQNVLGTIQPIKEAVQLVRSQSKPIFVHCDAVQAVGKMPLQLENLDVDAASFSSHKFEGVRGVGILYLKKGSIEALSRGGNQEGGLRPGTENIASIAAMNTALSRTVHSLESDLIFLKELREIFEQELKSYSPIKVIHPYKERDVVASIIHISVVPIPSEVFARVLSDKGFDVSSGSACSHNSTASSHSLLLASGLSKKEAHSSLRISFGHRTTVDEIKALAHTLIETHQQLHLAIGGRTRGH